MITRRGFAVLLTLGLLGFSTSAFAASDPREELLSLLRGENVDGFFFAFDENGTHENASFTNKNAFEVFTLNKEQTKVVLKYTGVKDLSTGSTALYRAETVRDKNSLRYVVTDLVSNQVIDNRLFPATGGGCSPAGQFESINACIKAFNCTDRGNLQCKADSTCKPQLVGLTCCLTDGSAFSVHLIIRPQSIRCMLQDIAVNLEGMVLSRD